MSIWQLCKKWWYCLRCPRPKQDRLTTLKELEKVMNFWRAEQRAAMAAYGAAIARCDYTSAEQHWSRLQEIKWRLKKDFRDPLQDLSGDPALFRESN